MSKLNDAECRFSSMYEGKPILLAVAVLLASGHQINTSNTSMHAAIGYVDAASLSGLPAYIATTQVYRTFKKGKYELTADTFSAHTSAIAATVLAEAGGIYGLQKIISDIQHDTLTVITQELHDSNLKPGDAGQGENVIPGDSPDGADAFRHAIQDAFGKSAEVTMVKFGPDGVEFEGADMPAGFRELIAALAGKMDDKPTA